MRSRAPWALPAATGPEDARPRAMGSAAAAAGGYLVHSGPAAGRAARTRIALLHPSAPVTMNAPLQLAQTARGPPVSPRAAYGCTAGLGRMAPLPVHQVIHGQQPMRGHPPAAAGFAVNVAPRRREDLGASAPEHEYAQLQPAVRWGQGVQRGQRGAEGDIAPVPIVWF